MALLEEFEKQGMFLFRWRSYIPSFIVLLSFFFIKDTKYSEYTTSLIYTAIFYFISLFGLFIRCFTIGYAPEKTSGRNTKKQVAETVNQKGIYSLIRHPLYVGNFFMFLGVVLTLQSLSFTIIFILFYWMYYERIMFTEEQFLRNKFKESYTNWADKTPAIIPRFKNYSSPELDFSFKNILKREYPSLFGITVIFLFYDVLKIYGNESSSGVDSLIQYIYPHHIYIFICILIFYIIVRILVKYTSVLNVEGR